WTACNLVRRWLLAAADRARVPAFAGDRPHALRNVIGALAGHVLATRLLKTARLIAVAAVVVSLAGRKPIFAGLERALPAASDGAFAVLLDAVVVERERVWLAACVRGRRRLVVSARADRKSVV